MNEFATVTHNGNRLTISPVAATSRAAMALALLGWLVATGVIVAASWAATRYIGWDRLFGGRLGLNMVTVDVLLSAVIGAIIFSNAMVAGRLETVVFDGDAGHILVGARMLRPLWEVRSVILGCRLADARTRLIRLELGFEDGESEVLYETSSRMREESAIDSACPDYDPDEFDPYRWLPYEGQTCGLGNAERHLIAIAAEVAAYLGLNGPAAGE